MSKIKHQKSSSRIRNVPSSEAPVSKISVCFYYFEETVANLSHVSQEFFRQMVLQCKVLGTLTWEQVYMHKGLGWDEVEETGMKFRIPNKINRKSLHHIKVSKKGRMWGYREGNSFHVVWLDPNHEVTPER